MPYILSAVHRFTHSAYGQGINHILFFFTLNILQEPVQGCVQRFFIPKIQLIPKPFHQTVERNQFILIRLVVNSIDERLLRPLFPDKLCHIQIGKQHKLFNQLIVVFTLFKKEDNLLILLIQDEFYF